MLTGLRRRVALHTAVCSQLTKRHSAAALPLLLHRSAATATKTKRQVPKKQVLQFDDLPTVLVGNDGQAAAPLPAYIEPTRKGRKPKLPVDNQDDLEFQAAVAANKVPETYLSRLVWDNWKRFPDCVLLTQVGNFYESYFEPAIHLSSVLGIKLTRKTYKSGQFPFTGFPIHQIDKYLKILVNDYGFTVAIIDEEKDPLNPLKEGEEIQRSVARVVTPGTLLDERWAAGSESRYLLAIAMGPQEAVEEDEPTPRPVHLAYADVSTGEFFTKEATTADIEDELARIAPREIVLDSQLRDEWLGGERADASGSIGDLFHLLRVLGVHVSFADPLNAPEIESSSASGGTKKRKVAKEAALPPGPLTMETEAISLLRHYLQYALRGAMPTIPDEFTAESDSTQMHIDAATLQALEIRTAFRPGGLVPAAPSSSSNNISVKGTLISTLSRTVTDSGHRLLRRTFSSPSTDLAEINSRLALVDAFVYRQALRTDIRDQLREVADVMRIVQRFRASRGDGTDVWDVGIWIRSVEKLLQLLRVAIQMEPASVSTAEGEQAEGAARLQQLVDAFQPLSDLAELIETSIDDVGVQRGGLLALGEGEGDGVEAAGAAMNGPTTKAKTRAAAKQHKDEEEARRREMLERQRWWIKPSFSIELGDLHKRIKSLGRKQGKLEARLREEYEAPSLSLVTSDKGGYFVQVKKKTELGNVERSGLFGVVSENKGSKTYTYGEWSALGIDMGKALAKLEVAKAHALQRFRAMVVEHAGVIQKNAELVDEVDLTASFAEAAIELRLTRPILNDGTGLDIINGRHPSVETGLLGSGRVFTPNSTRMTSSSLLHVITGPNQGGKSTLLRQTAIIAILAQSGSFVPAEHTQLGLVDRVFSRVGARDDLFRDRSTFMLEMVETAAILKHATPRSLVIMDEIGRGTTLAAGVSIAYATLDYVLREIGCRTLFATHYHELTTMLGAPVPSKSEGGGGGGSGGGGGGSAATLGVVTVPPEAEVREGVSFFCTDVDVHEAGEEGGDGTFSYSYRLRPGINYNSHAIKAAQLAGMPASFLATAEETLRALQAGEMGKVEA